MNERYNQIIDEVYENYFNKFKDEWIKQYQSWLGEFNHSVRPISKDEFINKIKTDSEFSEKWGLTIEERELGQEERFELFKKQNNGSHPEDIEMMDDYDIPTKVITLIYKNETIEYYEN